MKSFTHSFLSTKELQKFVDKNSIPNTPQVLIQIFTGIASKDNIKAIQKAIHTTLPQATAIGATTAGEIDSNSIHENTTIINISVFEHTKIELTSLTHGSKNGSFFSGKKIAQDLSKKNTKVIISFANGLNTNGEEFLKGIYSVSPEIPVAGGMAGDNAQFQQTYVFTKDTIITKGAIAVALNSNKLSIHTHYNFDWVNIGKYMTVTKAEKNRVYEINNMPVVDIYEKYLGPEIVNILPSVEFPLIVQRNGINIARDVLKKHKDGSLSLGGNIEEGEKVQFGYGNIDMILRSSTRLYHEVVKNPTEAIFMYSCCARKIFMGQSITCEIEPLNEIAPLSGFFTYGEFFHSPEENILFNETMTLLCLSESNAKPQKKSPSVYTDKKPKEVPTLIALSHLTSEVTHELMDLTTNLEDKVQEQTHKLRESYEQLKSLDKMKNEFISVVSHELRTPMTVIKSYASMLLDVSTETLSHEQKTYLEKISNNTTELIDLVNDMLDISKLEAGKFDDHKETIEIHKFIQDVVQEFTILADKGGITLFYNNPDKILQHILIDKAKLHRIFSNLISNAIKFTPHNGSITIELKKGKKSLRIAIIDTGVGIKEEKQKVIFEKFTQADNPLQREYDGTGLGLAIVKHLVESLGGKIKLKSKSGEGSTFTFTIPLDE